MSVSPATDLPTDPLRGRRRLLDVRIAATYLGVSRASVERLVQRGDLPIVKVGGNTRYDLGDLDAYIEQQRRRRRHGRRGGP